MVTLTAKYIGFTETKKPVFTCITSYPCAIDIGLAWALSCLLVTTCNSVQRPSCVALTRSTSKSVRYLQIEKKIFAFIAKLSSDVFFARTLTL